MQKIIDADTHYHWIDCRSQKSFFQEVNSVLRHSYPRFLIEDLIDFPEWRDLHSLYPEFQFGLVETESQKMVAQGSCLPIPWDRSLEELPNTGCDWILTAGLQGKENNTQPTILGGVSLTILPEYRGRGLSKYLLDYMQELARSYQFPALILAVRPTLKHLYPLTPIVRYIQWKNEAGLMFDPWLRVNLKYGAKLLGICDRSTEIIEPISYWEKTTQMHFPDTGKYIIPGGIIPLEIDRKTSQGYYIEPNIWISYPTA
ncbi:MULTISPECIES: GNAT family N-acetyltransferase [Spirulina sp. CCY15215]|uniref:GNAT family N-acetyltransferase n=1 Tax=Spirulina sp. CCY15215 TaxID=2767591 RepID=UPI00195028AD|nr:GNAT family N-acetyltransferase [Spirulina major]